MTWTSYLGPGKMKVADKWRRWMFSNICISCQPSGFCECDRILRPSGFTATRPSFRYSAISPTPIGFHPRLRGTGRRPRRASACRRNAPEPSGRPIHSERRSGARTPELAQHARAKARARARPARRQPGSPGCDWAPGPGLDPGLAAGLGEPVAIERIVGDAETDTLAPMALLRVAAGDCARRATREIRARQRSLAPNCRDGRPTSRSCGALRSKARARGRQRRARLFWRLMSKSASPVRLSVGAALPPRP